MSLQTSPETPSLVTPTAMLSRNWRLGCVPAVFFAIGEKSLFSGARAVGGMQKKANPTVPAGGFDRAAAPAATDGGCLSA